MSDEKDDKELKAIILDNINYDIAFKRLDRDEIAKSFNGRTPKLSKRDLEDPPIDKFSLLIIAEAIGTSIKELMTDRRGTRR